MGKDVRLVYSFVKNVLCLDLGSEEVKGDVRTHSVASARGCIMLHRHNCRVMSHHENVGPSTIPEFRCPERTGLWFPLSCLFRAGGPRAASSVIVAPPSSLSLRAAVVVAPRSCFVDAFFSCFAAVGLTRAASPVSNYFDNCTDGALFSRRSFVFCVCRRRVDISSLIIRLPVRHAPPLLLTRPLPFFVVVCRSRSRSGSTGSYGFYRVNTKGKPLVRGAVGLSNLGNTCFMNR